MSHAPASFATSVYQTETPAYAQTQHYLRKAKGAVRNAQELARVAFT
jgi:hypothetical protein